MEETPRLATRRRLEGFAADLKKEKVDLSLPSVLKADSRFYRCLQVLQSPQSSCNLSPLKHYESPVVSQFPETPSKETNRRNDGKESTRKRGRGEREPPATAVAAPELGFRCFCSERLERLLKRERNASLYFDKFYIDDNTLTSYLCWRLLNVY